MELLITMSKYWAVLVSMCTIFCCSTYSSRIQVSRCSINIRYKHQLEDGANDFTHTVDTSLFYGTETTNCSSRNDVYCIDWNGYGQFRISTIDEHCENYQLWTKLNNELRVTFDLTNISLYGGSEITNQTWPIKNRDNKTDSFVTKEYNDEAAMEPLWYTSTGFYLLVEQKVPLFISYAENSMSLIAKREQPYVRYYVTHLNYKVCKYDNIKTAFKRAIAVMGKPTAPPDYRMVELPIWSTWAKYKSEINESVVLEFANSIRKYGFPNSQLEIDDKWETCYGTLTVDKKRFPDMRGLVDKLHSMGFRVTLWVHPFVNVECYGTYYEAYNKKYFVSSTYRRTSTYWWNGLAAYIDFTDPNAVDWYKMRLQKLIDETGIDSFKFDAGESGWCPQPAVYNAMMDDHPETILKSYIAVAASFGNMAEVRAARQTQSHSVFLRMLDRETFWVGRRGLNTVIPELLHLNVIGYPYVLPDMIGGNGYNGNKVTKEMFIRWLEVNVFMPSLQFSYPPWDFDEEVINITRKYVELHKHYAPKIYELMLRATKEETMVNAPIWWIDPTDSIALTIDTEFLLGDILVAPILHEGATSRNIYFPKGIWRDETIKTAPYIKGPTWVMNYPARLEVLPHFTKMASSSSVLSPAVLLTFIAAIFLLH